MRVIEETVMMKTNACLVEAMALLLGIIALVAMTLLQSGRLAG